MSVFNIDEKRADYIANGGVSCLVCGHHDIVGGFIAIDAYHAYQKLHCTNCDASWQDIYTLTNVDEIDFGE